MKDIEMTIEVTKPDNNKVIICNTFARTRNIISHYLHQIVDEASIPYRQLKDEDIEKVPHLKDKSANEKNIVLMEKALRKATDLIFLAHNGCMRSEEIDDVIRDSSELHTVVGNTFDNFLELAFLFIESNEEEILKPFPESVTQLYAISYRVLYNITSLIVKNIKEMDTTEQRDIQLMADEEETLLNVSALELGMAVKNYKELCSLLKQPVLEGNSKKAQLKEFQRYFSYQKIGNKFLILDIYEKPLPINDQRQMGNNAIYVKYIEAILLRYMSGQKDYKCFITKKNLWMILGMINKNYSILTPKELEKSNGISQYMSNHFYQRCNQKLERILFSALINLRNRRIISYFEKVVIVDAKGNHFFANSEQIRRIDEIEKRVLNEMGLISVTQVYLKFLAAKFYSHVNQIMYEEEGWQYSYKGFQLIYTQEIVREEINIQECELQRLLLNSKIIEFMNNNAENIYMRQIDTYEAMCKTYHDENRVLCGMDNWGDYKPTPKEVNVWVYPEYYVEIQKSLSELLLRLPDNKKEENDKADESDIDELFTELVQDKKLNN